MLIKLGARLGGATKELLPNLDTYKNNEKSIIPLRFLFFGGCFGKQICSFLCVRASVRPGGRPSRYKSWLAFFWGPKIKNSVLILFARSPPKMHGQVRWSKFWSRDLTAKKIPSCVRASGRPAVKIQIVIGVFGGTKNPEFRPDTFCAEHLQNARTCRYKPQKVFFCSKIFINFGFCRKYARSGTILSRESFR